MNFSEWRANRNEQARARLLRNVPAGFPKQVLLHALARPFTPLALRRAVNSYWHHHPVRADRLARTLALRSGAPAGWTWQDAARKSTVQGAVLSPPAHPVPGMLLHPRPGALLHLWPAGVSVRLAPRRLGRWPAEPKRELAWLLHRRLETLEDTE